MTQQTPARALLSMSDAARYLGYSSERTIRRMIAEGQIPAYRLAGRTIRVRPSDLDALLERIPNGDGDRVA